VASPDDSTLDFTAAASWSVRAAAHVLGAGLLLAVLVALPAAPTDLDRHQLPKETVVHLVTWFAVLLVRPWPPHHLRPAARYALAGLLVISIVSALLANNGWLALRAVSLMITGAAALVTARQIAAAGAGAVLLAWCGVAGVVGAGTGLLQAYGVESALFATTRVPGGTFGNRNFMAHFAGLTLPIIALGALAARRRVVQLACTASAGVLVAAIILSRSRAAWLGAAAAVTTMAAACLIARRRQRLPIDSGRVITLAATAALAVIVALVVPNRLNWKSTSPYSDTLIGIANRDEGSGHGRMLQYRNTLQLAAHHPVLGVGPGNWPVRYAEVAPTRDPSWVFGDVVPLNPWPSSDWMALASESGLLAVALALLLGAAIAWRAVRAVRASGERVLAGAALLALLVVLFVEGNFDAVLLLPAPVLFAALSIGALLDQCDGPAAGVVVSRSVPGRPARPAVLLGLVLGAITLRSGLQTTAYAVAGAGRTVSRLAWAARIDPGSYPIRIALVQRLGCDAARADIAATLRMAPRWPAPLAAARRCGVRVKP
jgi:hypothetical protein